MANRTARLIGAIGILALVPAGLAACSGGQSVADACGVIESEMQSVSTELQEAFTGAASDPEGSTTALREFADAMKETGGNVTNEEVKEPYDTLVSGFEQAVTAMEGFGDLDPTDPDAMAEMEAASGDLDKVGEDVQSATTKLTELCG